jgi:starvation-inducible DNA-binding protein
MHRTRNDIAEKTRGQVAALLNARLADCVDLKLRAKHAHWNVKGPQFIALHELFDSVATALEGHSDALAERAVSLGGTAAGLVGHVAKGSSLPAWPAAAHDGPEHVAALSDGLAAFGKGVRKAIDQATALGDAVTADLFTEIGGEVDKQLWFLEAHLQGRLK